MSDPITARKPASGSVGVASMPSIVRSAQGAGPAQPVAERTASTPQDQFVGARPPAQRPPSASAPSPMAAAQERRAARNAAPPSGQEIQGAADRGSTQEIVAILDRIALGKAHSAEAAELISILRNKIRNVPNGAQTVAAIERAYGIDLGAVVKELEKDDTFDKILNEKSPIPRDGLADFASYDDRNGELLRKAVQKGLYKTAIDGTNPGGFQRILGATKDREKLATEFAKMLDDDGSLRRWIEADPSRLRRAGSLSQQIAPTDKSIEANRAVNEAVDNFRDWDKYPYQLIVVPGYTPLSAKEPIQMHPTQKARLEEAVRDFKAGRAPFIMVSGGNVHPPGTKVYEALEMKEELKRMGIPEDRIIVDARARHSTTNLRNVGRYMLDHGLKNALITTSGDQDFYFSCPDISDFTRRCMMSLGYEVGDLQDVQLTGLVDTSHSEFKPSRDVRRVNYRDPLDP